MFEEFSAGYYVGRLYVEPHDGVHAVLDQDQHALANEQVYPTSEGLVRLDQPLVVKLGECHFPVFPASDVPARTLGLPDAVLEATRVTSLPALEAVLVAKAEWAARLVRWATPYTIRAPDYA